MYCPNSDIHSSFYAFSLFRYAFFKLQKSNIQFPSQVTLMIDGEHSRNIVLKGKRMSGDQLPPDYVVVYTDECVDLDRDAVRRGGCSLVFLPEQR